MADAFDMPPVGAVPPLADQHRQRGQGRPGHHGADAYAAAAGAAAVGPRPPADAAVVLGIPEAMLTPEVRGAVTRLMAAVEEAHTEIDRRRRHEDLLDAALHRHPVLPLANRRGMARDISKLAAHVAQGGQGGTLVLLHVAGIERLRLAEGLAAADAVLGDIAAALLSAIRDSDTAANLGGSDFAVLLRLAELPAAEAKAADLAARAASAGPRWRGAGLSVTQGAAPVGADSTLATLLAEADAVRR